MFLYNIFALWLTSQILPALTVPGDWKTILFAGLTLSLLMLLVKPILKILFIPINILTFGLLAWVVNVIVLYILTILVPEIVIQPWTFPGVVWEGFVIPAVTASYTIALIVTSLVITIITDVLHYVGGSE